MGRWAILNRVARRGLTTETKKCPERVEGEGWEKAGRRPFPADATASAKALK